LKGTSRQSDLDIFDKISGRKLSSYNQTQDWRVSDSKFHVGEGAIRTIRTGTVATVAIGAFPRRKDSKRL
jgi:hypothetical protein